MCSAFDMSLHQGGRTSIDWCALDESRDLWCAPAASLRQATGHESEVHMFTLPQSEAGNAQVSSGMKIVSSGFEQCGVQRICDPLKRGGGQRPRHCAGD